MFTTLATSGAMLCIAALGGAIALAVGIPMPWLLGPLFAAICVSQLTSKLGLPKSMRDMLLPLLGASLGSHFTPAIINQLTAWPAVFACLALYVACSAVLGILYFRRVANFDLATSFFAATPGGLTDLTVIGSALGADIVRTGIVHLVRVLLVVTTMPFIVSFFVSEFHAATIAEANTSWTYSSLIGLFVSAVIGKLLSDVLRVPAGMILVPLVVCAAGHAFGLIEGTAPPIMVSVIQVVIGAYIGTQFGRLEFRKVRVALTHGVIWGSVLILLAFAAAALCAWITGLGFPQLLLAFAPGGIGEMGLLTLGLGIDVALVTSCHVLRVLMIYFVVPVVTRQNASRLKP